MASETAKEKFTKHLRATISDFLDEKFAQELYQYIQDKPLGEWQVSLYPWRDVFTFDHLTPEELKQGKESVEASRRRREFSYYFYRYSPHGTDPSHCPLCKFVAYLMSEECMKKISDITGKTYTEPVSIFASCYQPGCFLTTHTDAGRGRLAWSLNLTKDWSEAQGGCLQFLEGDYRTVKETVCPKFNSFTLFHVEGEGQPHQVTPVVEPEGKRIAVTGWFY